MLPIMIDEFLSGCKPDIGTFDVRGYSVVLDCLFCFLGLAGRGLGGTAGNREKQQDEENHSPDFICTVRESLYHRKNLSQVARTGRMNFPGCIGLEPQNRKFPVATLAADAL